MSSEMLDETVEEKAMAQQDQSQEKKKVTVKISPKKRVSVKKKIETPEEKVNEEPLPLSSSPVEEEKESPKEEAKPKKRGRKPHSEEAAAPRPRKPRAKKSSEKKEQEEAMLPFDEPENAPVEPEIKVESPEPFTEEKKEDSPETVEKAEAPIFQENQEAGEEAPSQEEGEKEEASDKEGQDRENGSEEKSSDSDRRQDRRDRFNRNDNRNNKFKNKKERRPLEDLPPEINLDENPDAPRLFISVLTALSLDQVRARAREDGIPEDVILDCRKQDLIAKLLRLHSQMGWALMVEGVLEILNDGGYGYIRYAVNNYLSGTEDVYI